MRIVRSLRSRTAAGRSCLRLRGQLEEDVLEGRGLGHDLTQRDIRSQRDLTDAIRRHAVDTHRPVRAFGGRDTRGVQRRF